MHWGHCVTWYWDGAESYTCSRWTLPWLCLDRKAVVHLTISAYSWLYAQGLNWFLSPLFGHSDAQVFRCSGGNVSWSGEPGCLDNHTKRMDEAKFTWWFLLQKQGRRLCGCSACLLPASACPVGVFLFCIGALPWCPLGTKSIEGCKVMSILH